MYLRTGLKMPHNYDWRAMTTGSLVNESFVHCWIVMSFIRPDDNDMQVLPIKS